MSRDLTRAGDLIDLVLGRVARAGVAPIVRLRREWDDVAGEWAARCRPVALERGVLTVEVTSGMTATMLRFEAPALAKRVDAHLGGVGDVTGVSVRVRGPGGGPE